MSVIMLIAAPLNLSPVTAPGAPRPETPTSPAFVFASPQAADKNKAADKESTATKKQGVPIFNGCSLPPGVPRFLHLSAPFLSAPDSRPPSGTAHTRGVSSNVPLQPVPHVSFPNVSPHRSVVTSCVPLLDPPLLDTADRPNAARMVKEQAALAYESQARQILRRRLTPEREEKADKSLLHSESLLHTQSLYAARISIKLMFQMHGLAKSAESLPYDDLPLLSLRQVITVCEMQGIGVGLTHASPGTWNPMLACIENSFHILYNSGDAPAIAAGQVAGQVTRFYLRCLPSEFPELDLSAADSDPYDTLTETALRTRAALLVAQCYQRAARRSPQGQLPLVTQPLLCH